MKFRSDFVTNSSSSSFCVMSIKLNDGTEIHWENEYCSERPIFAFPRNAKEQLKEIQTVEALIDFLVACSSSFNMTEEFMRECDDFLGTVRKAESIDAMDTLEMAWGLFESDQGETPEDGSEGGQLTYHFGSGECEIIDEPTEDFIEEMNCQYDYS